MESRIYSMARQLNKSGFKVPFKHVISMMKLSYKHQTGAYSNLIQARMKLEQKKNLKLV